MKQIYKKRTFVIYRVRDGHIIYNTKKPFSEGHTHVSNYDTAIRIMNIAISKEVPRHLSDYLLESLIRLTDDENFRIRIENLREIRKKGKIKGENMNFGEALEALKAGKRVARKGWNGKGMYLYLVHGFNCDKENLRNEASFHLTNDEVAMHGTGVATFLSHIDMRTASGDVCVGWLASQTDMLSEDWEVVE